MVKSDLILVHSITDCFPTLIVGVHLCFSLTFQSFKLLLISDWFVFSSVYAYTTFLHFKCPPFKFSWFTFSWPFQPELFSCSRSWLLPTALCSNTRFPVLCQSLKSFLIWCLTCVSVFLPDCEPLVNMDPIIIAAIISHQFLYFISILC